MIRMLVLRYAALLALVVWVGGLVALGGIAAPSIFDVIAARQVADGRDPLRARCSARCSRRFTVVSYAAGGVLLLTLIAAPHPRTAAASLCLARRHRRA